MRKQRMRPVLPRPGTRLVVRQVNGRCQRRREPYSCHVRAIDALYFGKKDILLLLLLLFFYGNNARCYNDNECLVRCFLYRVKFSY